MKMTSGQFQMCQTSRSTIRTQTMNKVAYFSYSLFFVSLFRILPRTAVRTEEKRQVK